MAIELRNQASLIQKYAKEKYNFTPEGLFLTSVRGYSYDGSSKITKNDNKINFFNDTMLVIVPTSRGPHVNCFECTTEPGLPWILKPMPGLKGTLRKSSGLYLYKFGLHKGIPALVQSSEIFGRRDVNKDGKWTLDEPLVRGFFAANIHPKLQNSKTVERNSAGCTVINSMRNEKPWMDFYRLLENSGNESFPYIVMEQEEFSLILS